MKCFTALLVLLCCSPCKMEVQEFGGNENSRLLQHGDGENSKKQPEAATVRTASIPQTCQPDILTILLTQMSSLLAEQRAELKNTKMEMANMEIRLRSNEKYVEDLQKENKAMAEELNNVNVKYSALEASVEQLKYQKQGMNVAFSAALVGSGHINNIGPLSRATTLAFKHVFTNFGSAYNQSTGIFKAPVRGVYQFLLYVYAPANENYPITTALMKNGHQVLVAHGHTTVKFTASSSNGVSLYLQAGDTVSVELWKNRIVFDNSNCHSTFSGHLLFTV